MVRGQHAAGAVSQTQPVPSTATSPAATLRVAVTQWNPGTDVAANLDVAQSLIRAAGAQGADLVLLPENGLMLGEAAEMRQAALRENGTEIDTLRAAAEHAQCTVVVGGTKLIDDSGVMHNSALVVDAHGQLCGRYDKIHLFDARVDDASFEASRVETPGQVPVMLRIRGWSIGISICYDIRFPELYRTLARAGADLFLVPAAFLASTGKAHWETLLRARAIENGAFVVASATVSDDHAPRAFPTHGHAMIVSPWGEILANLHEEAPAVSVVDIAHEKVTAARYALPVLEQIRPNAYTAEIDVLNPSRGEDPS